MEERGRRSACAAVERCRRALGALLLALLALGGTAWAAEPATPAPAVDVAELEGLVATLEDEAARARLVAQLRALIAAQRRAAAAETPQSLGASALEAMSLRLDQLGRRLVEAAAALVAFPRLVVQAGRALADPERRARWLVVAAKLALVLLAGLLAELAARRLLRRPLRALAEREGAGSGLRLALLALRTLLEVAAIGAFAAAAWGMLSLAEPRAGTRLAALALVNASVLARALLTLARALLAPRAPGLRVAAIGDETAHYWYLWARRLVNVGVYGYFTVEALLALGAPAALHGLLLDLLGLAVTGMLVVLVLQNRTAVAALIRGGGEGPPGWRTARRRLADLWHVAAVLYLVAAYLVWALGVAGGFAFLARASLLTVLVAVIASAANLLAQRALARLFALGAELKARYPGLEARANRYVPLLGRAARVLIGGVAVLAIAQAWGIDAFGWLLEGAGRALLARLTTVALIVLGALLVWEVLSSLIERQLERIAAEDSGRGTRLLTLLPLARKALLVTLSVMVALTSLSELGVDIGPLLAGAGVAGLAIGFGAQTLVKDLITGVFILVEDSIAVGDYVDVGGHSGTVESLSIRTIRLRDPSGNVHTVPFSEVTTVLNYTRDYGFAMLDVGVAYREDIDAVMEVLRALGEELQADPEWGPKVLEPIQVLGVQELADSAVVVRARIKTLPGEQWATRREFQRRIKNRFDELGIEIPFPHRTVYFGVDREGRAPAARLQIEEGGGPTPG